ncbi:MAG: ABC transporter substrate-binding protein, partial [Alphaproteobacteria bacterium]|nr:ABC transporter substrate-binding protein [Alphaproteobacteria bacterium]
TIEQLRDEWFKQPDLAGQRKVAAEIQTAAYDFVPYIPTGQFVTPTVYRKNLSGIITAPVAFLWNVEKN